MDKDLYDRLSWLAEELSDEERQLLFGEGESDFQPDPEPEVPVSPRSRRLSRAEKMERRQLEHLDPVADRSAPVVKKKGIKGLVFLAVLELIGIFLVMGWWLQWLI